jgi:hypothetical protein
MSSPSADAPISEGPSALADFEIPSLAKLYDGFANALDPFARERDEAERLFDHEVARIYDRLPTKPPYQIFRKAVIVRCRKHLRAMDKPASP